MAVNGYISMLALTICSYCGIAMIVRATIELFHGGSFVLWAVAGLCVFVVGLTAMRAIVEQEVCDE